MTCARFGFWKNRLGRRSLATLLERAVSHKSLVKETERSAAPAQLPRLPGGPGRNLRADAAGFLAASSRLRPAPLRCLITRRKRHRKRTGGGGDPQAEPQSGQAVCRGQLRGSAGVLDRERTVRPRKRIFYRRAGTPLPAVSSRRTQGTLLLDEIGEMPLPMQAKLLRVLEDSKVRRLGGTSEIPVDVRVLAATNRPVQESLEGKFLREDLYYRLNVFQIALPPLRHRKEDIPAIAEAIIRGLNQKHDCRVAEIHPVALERLMNHSWPGNVRELRNIIERAVIVAKEGAILPAHLPRTFGVPAAQQQSTPSLSNPAPSGESLYLEAGKPLSAVEKSVHRAHTEEHGQ